MVFYIKIHRKEVPLMDMLILGILALIIFVSKVDK